MLYNHMIVISLFSPMSNLVLQVLVASTFTAEDGPDLALSGPPRTSLTKTPTLPVAWPPIWSLPIGKGVYIIRYSEQWQFWDGLVMFLDIVFHFWVSRMNPSWFSRMNPASECGSDL